MRLKLRRLSRSVSKARSSIPTRAGTSSTRAGRIKVWDRERAGWANSTGRDRGVQRGAGLSVPYMHPDPHHAKLSRKPPAAGCRKNGRQGHKRTEERRGGKEGGRTGKTRR